MHVFSLTSVDNAIEIASFCKNLEDEGRLVRVHIDPHNERSALLCGQYMISETTEKEPFPYLKFMVDNNLSVSIQVYFRV